MKLRGVSFFHLLFGELVDKGIQQTRNFVEVHYEDSLSHLRLPFAPLVGEVGVNDVVEGAGDPAADSSARTLVRLLGIG